MSLQPMDPEPLDLGTPDLAFAWDMDPGQREREYIRRFHMMRF